MGVQDLWQLLAPAGRRVSIESLENKVLAIDISIWISQFTNAMLNPDGSVQANAHLIGTIRRILKLLYNKIYPVFVFDGATPALKINTVRKRRENIEKQVAKKRAKLQQKRLVDAIRYGHFNRTAEATAESEVVDLSEEKKQEEYPLEESDLDDDEIDYMNVSIQSMADYPREMRKQIIESARRQERAKRRSSYFAVANDPMAFSKSQISNFLKSSKMNTKIGKVQKYIEKVRNGDVPEYLPDEKLVAQEDIESEHEPDVIDLDENQANNEFLIEYADNDYNIKESIDISTSQAHVVDLAESDDSWGNEIGGENMDTEKQATQDLEELQTAQAIEASLSESQDLYRRVVSAAASMGDWAGNIMRKELKALGKVSSASSAINLENDELIELSAAPNKPGDSEQPVEYPKATFESFETWMDSWAKEDGDLQKRSEDLPTTVDARSVDPESFEKHQTRSMQLKDELRIEIVELLRAFELPYIVAPYEAEAQCAMLEQLELVDGIVTEDSDVFLFGGNKVYRNIFLDKKYVEVYVMRDIEREMGIDREDLVAMAYLLGSDYTEGVHGIGIVNAVEVVQAFRKHQGDRRDSAIECLTRFKVWLESQSLFDDHDSSKSTRKRSREDDVDELIEEFANNHRRAHLRWSLSTDFPNPEISKAYLDPRVDKTSSEFDWMLPNRLRVTEYCMNRLHWGDDEIRTRVDPVIEKLLQKTSTQPRIDSFFMAYSDNKKVANIASGRLDKCLQQLAKNKKKKN